MQRLFESQIQMHGARWPAVGRLPGPLRQRLQAGGRHDSQARISAGTGPTAAAAQKVFLVHRLVGTAALQPLRPVSAEQQQWNRAVIGFHRCWQQVGHRRAGGGDHRRRPTIGAAQPQREEGGGALVDRGVEL